MKTFEDLIIKSRLKDKILYALEHNMDCRNSDIELTIFIWRYFYNAVEGMEDTWGRLYDCVRIDSLFALPSQDNIKRIRAVIQNQEHLFLPTTRAVLKARKIWEQKWYQESFNNFNNI